MLRPSPRLDLLIVPRDEETPLQRGQELLAWLQAERIVGADGRPGEAARRWCPERFSRILLDRPEQVALYSSGQGGFRVRCPQTGVLSTAAFSAALSAARSGRGPWSMDCFACGGAHAFLSKAGTDLDFDPPAAFGRFALITADIGGPELAPQALEQARALLGPISVILRRG